MKYLSIDPTPGFDQQSTPIVKLASYSFVYLDQAFSALKVLEEHYGGGMVETGEDHSSPFQFSTNNNTFIKWEIFFYVTVHVNYL